MNVKIGFDKLVATWVCKKIGIPEPTTPYIGFAVYDNDGNFTAGVLVSNFRGTDCEVLMAAESPKWATRSVMAYVFDYIFGKMNCIRCTCITTKKNYRTRKFLEGIGFELEGNLRLGYDGAKDALIYGLLRRDCRFRGKLNGEEIRAEAAASAGPLRDGAGPKHDEQRDGGS